MATGFSSRLPIQVLNELDVTQFNEPVNDKKEFSEHADEDQDVRLRSLTNNVHRMPSRIAQPTIADVRDLLTNLLRTSYSGSIILVLLKTRHSLHMQETW